MEIVLKKLQIDLRSLICQYHLGTCQTLGQKIHFVIIFRVLSEVVWVTTSQVHEKVISITLITGVTYPF